MSVHSMHSVDHMGPPDNDDGYRGYDITKQGQVVEFYDHTNESSVLGGNSGISGSRRLLAEEPRAPAPKPKRPPARAVKQSAGCCSSCVGFLITIGRLPIASAVCFLLIWIGTGMFISAGWAVLDETQALFDKYGPVNGNPAKDPPPEYFLIAGGTNLDNRYELRNPDDLGNRVPEVFLSIKRAFCGIIPFMFIFSLMVVIDGSKSTSEIHSPNKGCKSSSSGICCSVSLIFLSYFLLLCWVFFVAFATLGVYYYRIVMLRCDDLNNRGFSDGENQNICLDLVQFGLIMFKNQLDENFGKICGPGNRNRPTVGDLEEYCNNYYHAWQLMLVCFAGALINVIAMMHSMMIVSGNYNALQRRFMRPSRSNHARTVASRSPATTRSTVVSSRASEPPMIVGTGNGSNHEYRRRHSKDIELDYMDHDDDVPSSTVTYLPPRRLEKDSNVGVDYYYKRY